MKFRPQRGGFADSMKEVVHVDGYRDLCRMVTVTGEESVTLKKYGTRPDPRNGWDTHVVLVNNQAVGFTNGAL